MKWLQIFFNFFSVLEIGFVDAFSIMKKYMSIIIKKLEGKMFPENNHTYEYRLAVNNKNSDNPYSKFDVGHQNYHHIDVSGKPYSKQSHRKQFSTPHYSGENTEQNYGFSNAKPLVVSHFGPDKKCHIDKSDIQNKDKNKNIYINQAAIDYRNIKNASLPSSKYSHIYNEIKEKQKGNIQRLPYNAHKNQQNCIQFLYKLFGIVSCHVKLVQRQSFTLLNNYSKCKQFCSKLSNFVNNNLQSAIISLKFNAIQQIQIRQKQFLDDIYEQKKAGLTKKYTKIDSLGDSNFILDESEVQKGLKYLQQRAKLRNSDKKKNNNDQNSATSIQNYNFNNPHSKNSVKRMSEFQLQKNVEKRQSPFQFNSKLQRKIYSKKQKDEQPPKETQKTNNNNKAIPQQEQDIYLKLQRQSKRKQQEEARKTQSRDVENQIVKNFDNHKLARSILLRLNQNPYNANERKFVDLIQINKLKYHLIPDTLKGEQPDVRQFALPLQSHVAYNKQNSYSNLFQLQNYLISHTGQFNLEPSDIQTNLKTQSNLKLESLPNSQTKKFVQKKSLTKIQDKANQHIISFNENQNLNIKKSQEQNSKIKKSIQSEQTSQQQILRIKNKRKCESEGDAIQFNNQITPKINRTNNANNNGMDEYYTTKKQKNPIKASYDFPSNSNASKPAARPKSVSHSINGSQSLKQLPTTRPVTTLNINNNNNFNNDLQLAYFSGDQSKLFCKQRINVPGEQNFVSQSIHIPQKAPTFKIIPKYIIENKNQHTIVPLAHRQIRSISNQCRYSQHQHFNQSVIPNQISNPINFSHLPNAPFAMNFQNAQRQPYFQKQQPMTQVREQRSKSNTVNISYNYAPQNIRPQQYVRIQRPRNPSLYYAENQKVLNINTFQSNFNQNMRSYHSPSNKGIQVYSSSSENQISPFHIHQKPNLPAQLPGKTTRNNRLINSEYF